MLRQRDGDLRFHRDRRRARPARRWRARLSESGRHRVLLLEAGEDDRWIWLRVPLGAGKVLLSASARSGASTPSPSRTWATAACSGRAGGCSAARRQVNGMLWVRGEPAEYDHWRDLGNPGWGYDDVLPYLKRIESYAGGDRGTCAARDGPVHIDRYPPRYAGRRLPRRLRRGRRSRNVRLQRPPVRGRRLPADQHASGACARAAARPISIRCAIARNLHIAHRRARAERSASRTAAPSASSTAAAASCAVRRAPRAR